MLLVYDDLFSSVSCCLILITCSQSRIVAHPFMHPEHLGHRVLTSLCRWVAFGSLMAQRSGYHLMYVIQGMKSYNPNRSNSKLIQSDRNYRTENTQYLIFCSPQLCIFKCSLLNIGLSDILIFK